MNGDEIDSIFVESEKVKRNVEKMWKELYEAFPEGQRSSTDFLVRWNQIHAYDQVWTDVALEIPEAGRLADAAIDAKTSVRILEIVLERQSRVETKIDHLVVNLKFVKLLAVLIVVILVAPQIHDAFIELLSK